MLRKVTQQEQISKIQAENNQQQMILESTRTALRSLVRVDELTTDELTAIIDLYEPYEVGRAYDYPDIVRYDGKLYQVREGQAHTSQADWAPPDLPALYRALMPESVIGAYDPNRNLAANPFQPGEKMIWTDGLVYESIHPTPHAWTPAEYSAAWKLLE